MAEHAPIDSKSLPRVLVVFFVEDLEEVIDAHRHPDHFLGVPAK